MATALALAGDLTETGALGGTESADLPASLVVLGVAGVLGAPDGGLASRVVVAKLDTLLKGVNELTAGLLPELGVGVVCGVHVAFNAELAVARTGWGSAEVIAGGSAGGSRLSGGGGGSSGSGCSDGGGSGGVSGRAWAWGGMSPAGAGAGAVAGAVLVVLGSRVGLGRPEVTSPASAGGGSGAGGPGDPASGGAGGGCLGVLRVPGAPGGSAGGSSLGVPAGPGGSSRVGGRNPDARSLDDLDDDLAGRPSWSSLCNSEQVGRSQESGGVGNHG